MAKERVELLRASVGHARLWPKKNAFKYRVFYLKLPITKQQDYATPLLFSFNRFNLLSIYAKDFGRREKDTSLWSFIIGEIKKSGIPFNDEYSISLIAHPRIIGYAFNPITYWLIEDKNGSLRAVMCEVHNTFKQTHNYFISKPDNSEIKSGDDLKVTKKLYVSPYTPMEGHYEFDFASSRDEFKSVINYFDKERQVLNTYVSGGFGSFSSLGAIKVVIWYPFMTVLVVLRIHYQALKLFIKGVKSTLKIRPRKYKSGRTTFTKED